jgi:hypothetical protein
LASCARWSDLHGYEAVLAENRTTIYPAAR